ncbi:MAG TPA: helix-turn-helix domain-containing protein [Candidatus Thermoplasmatota archaeon]|nr:helix-turn-helix domain-containing protein [Candidatus Thermoplasmatota archaeon]
MLDAAPRRPSLDVASDVLGRKWRAAALRALAEAPLGFNALKRAMPGVTAKVLASALADLERRGLVERRRADGALARVEYRLTPAACDLAPVLEALAAWSRRWT